MNNTTLFVVFAGGSCPEFGAYGCYGGYTTLDAAMKRLETLTVSKSEQVAHYDTFWSSDIPQLRLEWEAKQVKPDVGQIARISGDTVEIVKWWDPKEGWSGPKPDKAVQS